MKCWLWGDEYKGVYYSLQFSEHVKSFIIKQKEPEKLKTLLGFSPDAMDPREWRSEGSNSHTLRNS